jgi:hypothetical protein
MRLARHASQPDHAEQELVGVPVVLPQVVAIIDDTGRARLAVDGVERPNGPVGRDELGGVLARIADQHGRPMRVEIREPDGSRYADILQPQPRSPEPNADGGQEHDAPAEPVLWGEGFLPGEVVLVAVVAMTTHAAPEGAAYLTDPPPVPGRSGEIVLFGSASGTVVRGSLAAPRASQPSRRRWWR